MSKCENLRHCWPTHYIYVIVTSWKVIHKVLKNFVNIILIFYIQYSIIGLSSTKSQNLNLHPHFCKLCPYKRGSAPRFLHPDLVSRISLQYRNIVRILFCLIIFSDKKGWLNNLVTLSSINALFKLCQFGSILTTKKS